MPVHGRMNDRMIDVRDAFPSDVVPAIGIDELLQVADFVSVGTNDLLQYLTASDRDNPEVIDYQDARSSGLLLLLDYVMQRARAVGMEAAVSVCGQLASETAGARVLVALGITSLSIAPEASGAIRQAIEQVDVSRKSINSTAGTQLGDANSRSGRAL